MTNTHGKGSRWRHDVERWFTDAGFATTVRGIGYQGDDVLVCRSARTTGLPMVSLRLSVEAKNHRELDLAGFVDQASRQAADYDELTLPLVVAHRRGHARVDGAYCVMPGWAFIELVTR